MKVSEWFYSIQGEGVTAGKPALFIRLAGCNFMCGGFGGELLRQGKATWYCDTEPVWKQGREVSAAGLITEINKAYPQVLGGIKNQRINIIITGGEPTLPHNIEAVQELREWFTIAGISPFYEVETNASMLVDYDCLFDQINASPKLANSGMPRALRQNRQAIDLIQQHRNAWFKFVVNTEEDVCEIEREWVTGMGVREDRLILMPGCDNIADLQKASVFAAQAAIDRGWRFSSRIQVAVWDKTTGV